MDKLVYLVKEFFNSDSKLLSFLRFATVGVINTIHYYIWYVLFLYLNIPYIISHSLAFFISMVGSFFLNCLFTFKVKPTIKNFVKFPLSVLPNFIISALCLVIFVNLFRLSENIASLMAMFISIPITFLITKLILSNSK